MLINTNCPIELNFYFFLIIKISWNHTFPFRIRMLNNLIPMIVIFYESRFYQIIYLGLVTQLVEFYFDLVNVVGSNPAKSKFFIILIKKKIINSKFFNGFVYHIISLIDFNSNYIGLYKLEDAILNSKNLNFNLLFLGLLKFFIIKCKYIKLVKSDFKYKKNFNNKKFKKIKTKEMSFSLSIDLNDYETKLRTIKKFFLNGNKVKICLKLRGRELYKTNTVRSYLFNLVNKLNNFGLLDNIPNTREKNIYLYFTSKCKK